MKKLTLSLVTLVALAFAPGWAKADSSIPVTINGQAVEMNMPPALYDDTLLVPVESIVDRLGAQMSWDDQLQLLTLQKEVLPSN
ncbi:copper amine oxidase N-terminal domain-containing protein [Paenibacillus sp. CC-CFT747]|nr:copper amine oxidase N-terminal domain-containing protein [Paenibacillus sp. CC-CFT747]